MPSQKNQQRLEVLKEKLKQSKAFAIVNYEGTNVADQVELRAKLSEAGAEFFVSKNTLIELALENEELVEVLSGMNAIVFSYDDQVSAFKQVVDFHEETDKLELKKGWMQDRVLGVEEMLKLSKLPSKDELIGQLMAQLQGPASGLVSVLQAGQKDLLYVLKEIKDEGKLSA